MPESHDARTRWTIVLLWLGLAICVSCSRAKYRLSADREAYATIAERNGDPRWQTADYSIEIDPRSRYSDVYNPDRPPLPPDDPTAHQYMHRVDGKKGWKYWHQYGTRSDLENPGWREALAEYVEVNAQGAVKLDVDSALKLAYVHSPTHQFQLETLYLSALDVTTERFRLETQFFGGYGARYVHNGSLIPPALRYVPALGRFVIEPAIDGVENNRLTVGRPFGADPALLAQRRFATAGELLAGFANSFVFEFNGPNAGLSASLLNFTFLQPLLRGAGRDVALEQLTFSERALLANLRAYAQFRQGFYTLIAIGEQGVGGPQRAARSTSLQVFSGQGGVDGYVGLLQQLQQIRNSEDNLNLQLRTLEQLEFRLAAGEIDLVQVDQFRQNVESERASLLLIRNNFERALDTYKTSSLGLPPDLLLDLDDNLIRQFQLVDRQATAIQDAIAYLQDRKGQLPLAGDVAELRQIQSAAFELMLPLRRQLDRAIADFERMQESVPARKQRMSEDDIQQFERELQQLDDGVADLELQFVALQDKIVALRELEKNANHLPDEQAGSKPADARPEAAGQQQPVAADEASDAVVNLLRDMLRLSQSSILVQARARLETVMVETINLPSEAAFQIALANRLDFMNGRAFLVDSWRLIQVNADALQSVLNVTASGDMRTARNNPLSFRAPTSNLSLGLQFDAPLTRLVERNSYRESLINYQRNRRAFIQSRDALHLDLRVLLRQIDQLRTNLEIQRRAVAIAIRRVDLTREALYAPVRPPQPGQRAAQFGPTAAINLLSAQTALRDTQNAFLGAWLSYYAAKMRLFRELGIMQLDAEGRWIETPLSDFGSSPSVEDARQEAADQELNQAPPDLPPPVPLELVNMVNSLPDDFKFEVKADAAAAASKPTVEDETRPPRLINLPVVKSALPWLAE